MSSQNASRCRSLTYGLVRFFCYLAPNKSFFFRGFSGDLSANTTTTSPKIVYLYTYGGEKLCQLTTSEDNSSNRRTYIGQMQFVNDTLESIQHADGRAVMPPDDTVAHFQYRIGDHLNNTVVFFEDINQDGNIQNPEEVLIKSLYYPFGMKIGGLLPDATTPPHRYGYNNKEFSDSLGLSDYGMRWYDGVIGRFAGVDPIAERFAWVSPYNYAENSPIGNIDLWGLQKLEINYRIRDLKLLKGEWTAEQYSEDVHGTDFAAAVGLIVVGGGVVYEFGEGVYLWAMANPEAANGLGGLLWGLGTDEDMPGGMDDAGRTTRRLLTETGDDVRKAVWAQKTFSKTFSKTGQQILSRASGQSIKTIDDAVSALQSGKLSVADLPIDVITRDGKTLILNTRSSVALTKAGIPRSQWNIVDRTGQQLFEELLDGQLRRNNLTNAGTNVVRESGTQNVITY